MCRGVDVCFNCGFFCILMDWIEFLHFTGIFDFVFCCGLLPCRKQFDLANREAMDESAEWRRRFDSEHEKSAKCSRELNEVRSFV